MTPADIQNKKFDKSMGGYRTDEVHQFMTQVADYVRTLEKENQETQKKMEVLADKLEQYREDEESLRAALIGAQRLGQSVVREAQQKAEAIVVQATKQAEALVSDAQRSIDREAMALKMIQKDVAGFKELVIRMYTEQLAKIKASPEATFIPRSPAAQVHYKPVVAPDPAAAPVESIEDAAELQFTEVTGDGESSPSGEADTKTFTLVGADSSTKNQDAVQKEGGRDSKRARFSQINQFFGEDKPIERQ